MVLQIKEEPTVSSAALAWLKSIFKPITISKI